MSFAASGGGEVQEDLPGSYILTRKFLWPPMSKARSFVGTGCRANVSLIQYASMLQSAHARSAGAESFTYLDGGILLWEIYYIFCCGPTIIYSVLVLKPTLWMG